MLALYPAFLINSAFPLSLHYDFRIKNNHSFLPLINKILLFITIFPFFVCFRYDGDSSIQQAFNFIFFIWRNYETSINRITDFYLTF